MNKVKVLVLGTNSRASRRIKKAVEDLGHKCRIANPKDFVCETSNSRKHDKIYYKGKRVYRHSIDVIIPRIGTSLNYSVDILRHLTINIGIPTVVNADSLLLASHKWKSTQILSNCGLIVPKSLYLKNPNSLKFIVSKLGGLEDGNQIVAKLIRGSQGKGVFILDSLLSAQTAIDAFSKLGQALILSEFIKTAKDDENAWDLRVWVVNGKVVGAMKRYSLDDDFRSNVTISKKAEVASLTENQETAAIMAAKALDMNVAAVDLMVERETKKTFVIECNGCGGFGIVKYTGINIPRLISEYAISLGKFSLSERLHGAIRYSSDPKDIELNFDGIFNDVGIDPLTDFHSEELENEYSIKNPSLYECENAIKKLKEDLPTSKHAGKSYLDNPLNSHMK